MHPPPLTPPPKKTTRNYKKIPDLREAPTHFDYSSLDLHYDTDKKQALYFESGEVA